MRKFVTTLSTAVLVLATATAALAIETTARINFIDRDAGIIILAGGDQVIVPDGFDISTLNLAMLVTAIYDDAGDEPYQATEITIH